MKVKPTATSASMVLTVNHRRGGLLTPLNFFYLFLCLLHTHKGAMNGRAWSHVVLLAASVARGLMRRLHRDHFLPFIQRLTIYTRSHRARGGVARPIQ